MPDLWDTLVTGFETVVDFSNNGSIISDAVNGAMFGAITTAIGGGDIAEGAAWGAAGNAIAGYGDESIFNIAGRGVSGYGIDKAMGGDGLIGGAGGLLAGYMEGDEGVTRTKNNQTDDADNTTIESPPPADKGEGLLEKYGLQNEKGDGTLLGKGLVTALAGYGQSEAREDEVEQAAKLRDKSERNRKELDEEFQQRNLAGFKQPSMIVRNG